VRSVDGADRGRQPRWAARGTALLQQDARAVARPHRHARLAGPRRRGGSPGQRAILVGGPTEDSGAAEWQLAPPFAGALSPKVEKVLACSVV
jgi:hypothetical protein